MVRPLEEPFRTAWSGDHQARPSSPLDRPATPV